MVLLSLIFSEQDILLGMLIFLTWVSPPSPWCRLRDYRCWLLEVSQDFLGLIAVKCSIRQVKWSTKADAFEAFREVNAKPASPEVHGFIQSSRSENISRFDKCKSIDRRINSWAILNPFFQNLPHDVIF